MSDLILRAFFRTSTGPGTWHASHARQQVQPERHASRARQRQSRVRQRHRYARVREAMASVALAVGLALSAVATVSAQGTTGAPAGSTGAAAPGTGGAHAAGIKAGSYRIQAGDMLSYRVWPNAELSGEFPVETTGLVYLPMLGGVAVGGKTVDEVRTQLREMYGKTVQGSTQPVVTVTAQFAFSITGGVADPGFYEGTAGMSVFDAVSRAGGFRNEAVPKYVEVAHQNGRTDRIDIQNKGAEGQSGLASVQMQSQDRIIVPIAHRTFTTQNLYSVLQLLIGAATAIKVFGN